MPHRFSSGESTAARRREEIPQGREGSKKAPPVGGAFEWCGLFFAGAAQNVVHLVAYQLPDVVTGGGEVLTGVKVVGLSLIHISEPTRRS